MNRQIFISLFTEQTDKLLFQFCFTLVTVGALLDWFIFCDNGIFCMENGTVTVLITRDRLHAMQSARFVDDVFEGSLPSFLAAFSAGKRLTKDEIDEIQRMIDKAREK